MGRPTEYTLPKSDQLLIAFWDQVEAARDRYGEVRAVQLLTQALTNLDQSLERNHTPMSTDTSNTEKNKPITPNPLSPYITTPTTFLQPQGMLTSQEQQELEAMVKQATEAQERLQKALAVVRVHGFEMALRDCLISVEEAEIIQAMENRVRSMW